MNARSIMGSSFGDGDIPVDTKILQNISKNSVLSLSSSGNVVVVVQGKRPTEKEENAVQSSVQRLGRKRQIRKKIYSKRSFRGQTKRNVSMMTLNDQDFPKDNFLVASQIGERYIGILSGPEHVGRFG